MASDRVRFSGQVPAECWFTRSVTASTRPRGDRGRESVVNHRRTRDDPARCYGVQFPGSRTETELVMSRLIDVSHTVEHGMITYKGLPAPVISDHLSREESKTRYAPGTEFHIGKIEMVANTGTYLDSPFHRYARGKDLAALDLYQVANLDGIVVRCPDPTEITEAAFREVDVNGNAVLVHTGWDRHWRTEEYSNGNHPYLTESAATYLAKNG